MNEVKHFEVPGPGSAYSCDPCPEDPYCTERNKILSITPKDKDPLLYWHQVAQDAIHSAARDRVRLKTAMSERDKAKQDLEAYIQRLIKQVADPHSRTPLDMSHLFDMAKNGEISFNISLSVSAGANSACIDDDMKGEPEP